MVYTVIRPLLHVLSDGYRHSGTSSGFRPCPFPPELYLLVSIRQVLPFFSNCVRGPKGKYPVGTLKAEGGRIAHTVSTFQGILLGLRQFHPSVQNDFSLR